ncbi:hypothetical protein Ancab_028647 [Ancistrocladus abbreviatus]
MIGSFITRGLVMVFGYAYPAYECFKTVEKNKPEIEQLRFWCQYWILVAVLTVCERIGDAFISWVPMYSEAKLAFYIFLWYPKTKVVAMPSSLLQGTTYVYDSFFRPYVAKHETEIDRNLLEVRTRAGDIAVLYWQKAASYGQTRIFEILQYVAAQSTPRGRPTQPQQQAQPQNEKTPSPTSSTSSGQHQKEVEQEMSSSSASSTAAPPAAAQNVPKEVILQPAPRSSSPLALKKTVSAPEAPSQSALKKTLSAPESSSQSTTEEAQDKQIEQILPPSEDENPPLPPQETVMEEAIRVTRARFRKTRSTAK